MGRSTRTTAPTRITGRANRPKDGNTRKLGFEKANETLRKLVRENTEWLKEMAKK